MNFNAPLKFKHSGILSLCIAATAIGTPAQAQENAEAIEEVVVTGYRGGLLNSTNAKRESNGFSDEIFADDIGKMPSQNLAESLSRIPGVVINRDYTGEGLQIAVRGLGPSFTKVALNGNNIAIASDGPLNAGQRNREVDLGLFPTEIFTRLSVSKSSNAANMEGGISGYVNMRTARAFDNPDQRVNFSLEGVYREINEETSPKAAFTYSNTWDDKFGMLLSFVGSQSTSRVDGYETIGYTDGCQVEPDPTDTNPGNFSCIDGSLGRNQIHWSPSASPDYAADFPGVNAGDPIDPVATSGLDAATLDRGIYPYLGRGGLVDSDVDNSTMFASFEYRPNDDMSFVLDLLNSDLKRDYNRISLMFHARRTYHQNDQALVPVNLSVDDIDVIRQATLYNSSFFVEARNTIEEADFLSVMPSFSWQINSVFHMDLSTSFTDSSFSREEPTWLYRTPRARTTYSLANDIPTFDSALDVNDPNLGWYWDGIRYNSNVRATETLGLHADFQLGEDADNNGLKFGLSYDENSRDIETYGNTGLHSDLARAAVPDSDVGLFLNPMTASDFGGTFDGDLGYDGFAQIDYDAIKSAYDYPSVVATAGRGNGDQFGQGVGNIAEEYTALYLEANTETELLGRSLRMNIGTRYVHTSQITEGAYRENPDGSELFTVETDYKEWLPSFSSVYSISEQLLFRVGGSRTMTRADPGDIYPNSGWGTSGIDRVNAGNPELKPFFADSVDFGIEWYFDELGYIGFTHFNKRVTGFTRNDDITVLIGDLQEDWGFDLAAVYDPVEPDQERVDSINDCGGPEVCTTTVRRAINVDGSTVLSGFETIWVQPLDGLINGLGFNASVTKINQSSDSPEAIVTGIADWTYNFTGFYENEGFQVRVTYNHQDEAIAGGFVDGAYDGDPLRARRNIALARSQVDLAMSYVLPFSMPNDGEILLTFDAYNLTGERVGQWYGDEGVPNNLFYPGATYTFGLRGSF